MFDTPGPRVFALPPGADFAAELVRGLEERMGDAPPEDWARVEIHVNTARLRRRLIDVFAHGPARLLPRIRLLTGLSADPLLIDLPPALPPLRRKLDLARLVSRLIDAQPDIAPRAAIYDLADSLSDLFDEMHAEGVSPDDLDALDVSDQSGHWQRALRFLTIARDVVEADSLPSAEARLRLAAETLAARWAAAPPDHPVIVAGSTGSRGPVSILMQAVARLPQGAVVLPGVDRAMPPAVWKGLTVPQPSPPEDHPQYRFATFCTDLGLDPAALPGWTDAHPVPARAALLSMALRPAPITDQWMSEGPRLGDMAAATEGLSLIEAADPGEEALAIALRLRRALDSGLRCALITPDRVLTRRVQAALDRWGIVADDSAGDPLHLSPPGRLLRQIAACLGDAPGPEELLALLKHPLTQSGGARNTHALNTRRLDVWLRDHGAPQITGATLATWSQTRPDDADSADWARTLGAVIDGIAARGPGPLPDLVAGHVALAEALSGPGGTLWDRAEGRAARTAMDALAAEADAGGSMSPGDYARLIDTVLMDGEIRRPDDGRPDLAIWGTLEARVGGADLVILAGLSDGTWPEPPSPDPWLNRSMRQSLGLLLPERRIGLSAHDFQQAACAPQVVFSRAVRDAEAETVMSRWLNRLTNLLSGLSDTGGPAALKMMRERGEVWLEQARRARALTIHADPAHRPSPRPPVDVRPDRFSVTRIETLVRDPYAIYAQNILKLYGLNPLRPDADARIRGTLFHGILEAWLKPGPDLTAPNARDHLLGIARDHLSALPWAIARTTWLAQIEDVADWLIAGEITRQTSATPIAFECRAEFAVPGTGITLRGTADRIDRAEDGTLTLIDYKTGAIPSPRQILRFDRQLLLEAIMAEAGGFTDMSASPVGAVCHIGLGSARRDDPLPLRTEIPVPREDPVTLDPDAALAELQALLSAYARRSRGYTSMRAMESRLDWAETAHLARFGEWDLNDPAQPEDVG